MYNFAMEQAISFLYLFNAVITVFAYAPQIVKLRKIKARPKNFSLTSWFLWTYTSIISLLYATFVVRDVELIVVGSLSFAFVLAILAILLYKNIKMSHRSRVRCGTTLELFSHKRMLVY